MDAFRQLRIAAHTVAATAAGLVTVAAGRGERAAVRLVIGDAAPDFALPGSDGRTHRLADSRGREAIVLAWFPKAFTGGCTAECESLGGSRMRVDEYAARVFGASIDREDTNRRFAAALGLGFPLLSDPGGVVARAYGVIGASGFPHRWTFYIGLDGRILDIDRRVHAASHGGDVAARLGQLGVPRR
jgi:peroxiredoxin Q/BCP